MPNAGIVSLAKMLITLTAIACRTSVNSPLPGGGEGLGFDTISNSEHRTFGITLMASVFIAIAKEFDFQQSGFL